MTVINKVVRDRMRKVVTDSINTAADQEIAAGEDEKRINLKRAIGLQVVAAVVDTSDALIESGLDHRDVIFTAQSTFDILAEILVMADEVVRQMSATGALNLDPSQIN